VAAAAALAVPLVQQLPCQGGRGAVVVRQACCMGLVQDRAVLVLVLVLVQATGVADLPTNTTAMRGMRSTRSSSRIRPQTQPLQQQLLPLLLLRSLQPCRRLQCGQQHRATEAGRHMTQVTLITCRQIWWHPRHSRAWCRGPRGWQGKQQH